MTYMNRDDRRTSIVEAAVRLILRDGLAAATVRGVAKALDASPGQIHHHFSSADELRAEAFKALWAQATAGFDERLERLPPRERLVTALVGDDLAIETLTARLWNDCMAASGADPHVRAAVRETMGQWLAALVEAIEAGLETGEFTASLPPEEIARRLASLCLGIDILASLGLPEHSRDEVRTRLEAGVDAMLGPAA